MSHVVSIRLDEVVGEEPALEDIFAALEAMGAEIHRDCRRYVQYPRHVGDYPLPRGFTADELGKCDHMARFPDCRYEVGVVLKDGRWQVIYDFFDGQLSGRMGAAEATHFVEALRGIQRQNRAVAAVREAARQKRLPVQLQRLPSGVVKLTVRVP